MEIVNCPKCGQEIEIDKLAGEENFIGIPDHAVKFTGRWFHSLCPKCGPVFHPFKVGHHGTIARKQLKTLFPKSQLKRLRAALPEDQRKLFDATLSGKRVAKDGEVRRWLQVLSSISNATSL